MSGESGLSREKGPPGMALESQKVREAIKKMTKTAMSTLVKIYLSITNPPQNE